jgi:hypothetical protein
MAVETAISPFQICEASLRVREAITKIMTFGNTMARIIQKTEVAKARVIVEKENFNRIWKQTYSNISDYWTFEFIINSFQVFSVLMNS